MSHVAVTAASRKPAGKSEARRLRRAGSIPAVAYGKGEAAHPLAVAPGDMISVLKSEAGRNSVISMKVDNTDLLVMIKDYTLHPVTRRLEHIDFMRVSLDTPVEVDVPLTTSGKAAGVAAGGVLHQVFRTLPVRCLPNQIPLKIEVDVTALALQEVVETKDLKLPEGVSVRLPADLTIIGVVAPEKDRSEDEAAAAAPAAAAAAPAKDAKDAGKDAKDAKKK